MSVGESVQSYMHLKLFSSKEAHVKVMAVSLEAVNAILPSTLYADPMLLLTGTLTIFKAMIDSLYVVPKDKGQVAEAGDYFAKWLATVATLVHKSTPAVVALYDAIPHSERDRQRGPGKTHLFDVTHRLAYRVLLTKLVELDGDICPYLTALMVATLMQAGRTLVMLGGI